MAEEYHRRLPNTWWLRKGSYLVFMVRELTSVFVAGYAVFLLILIGRADDLGSWGAIFETLKGTPSLILHLLVLAMVVFHAVTWINLTPKVVVVWRGEEQISPRLVAAANYLAWMLVSFGVAVAVLR